MRTHTQHIHRGSSGGHRGTGESMGRPALVLTPGAFVWREQFLWAVSMGLFQVCSSHLRMHSEQTSRGAT